VALLDDSCRIDPVSGRYPTLRDFARDATRRLPEPSVVMIIADQRCGHDRPGVTEDHTGRPKPSPSSSSDRAATSLRLARPAPKNAGGQDRCPVDSR